MNFPDIMNIPTWIVLSLLSAEAIVMIGLHWKNGQSVAGMEGVQSTEVKADVRNEAIHNHPHLTRLSCLKTGQLEPKSDLALH